MKTIDLEEDEFYKIEQGKCSIIIKIIEKQELVVKYVVVMSSYNGKETCSCHSIGDIKHKPYNTNFNNISKV